MSKEPMFGPGQRPLGKPVGGNATITNVVKGVARPLLQHSSGFPEGWDRDESKTGTIFYGHTCYRCRDGELPCPHKGKERNCDTLRARND